MSQALPPGATIGLLGSGQLGRMLTQAAQPLGYRVHLFAPDADSPAGRVVDVHTQASYEDRDALQRFGQQIDVLTYEFENLPLSAVETVGACVPVHPRPQVLGVAQQRTREKTTLRELGFPVGPFHVVRSEQDLGAALEAVGTPCVLKTATSGYDGKGQIRIEQGEDASDAWRQLGQVECVCEGWVEFERELSVVVARDQQGALATYGPIENEHANHILDLSICPARVPDATVLQARQLACDLVEKLEVVGVICIELFDCGPHGLLVNEIAPRPHNSGHLTIEGHACSQFEQQARAVVGLPLGDSTQLKPAAMANLLGEVWEHGRPNWDAATVVPRVYVHLYDKQEPRAGRKMGHLTALGETVEQAVERARSARSALTA